MTRLTAAQLGVTQHDYDALLATREILSRPLPDGLAFSMDQFLNTYHPCGTACCIGGYMRLTVGERGVERAAAGEVVSFSSIRAFLDDESPFDGLFYPNVETRPWSEMTPPVAVKAIDQFLAGNTRDPWGFFRVPYPEEIG